MQSLIHESRSSCHYISSERSSLANYPSLAFSISTEHCFMAGESMGFSPTCTYEVMTKPFLISPWLGILMMQASSVGHQFDRL